MQQIARFFERSGADWVARQYLLVKILILIAAVIGFTLPFGERLLADKNYIYRTPDAGSLVSRFTPFDGQWYLQIAENGYQVAPLYAMQRNYNFFPLYPAFMALLSPVVGGSAMAGLLISYAAGFGLAYFLYRLVVQDYPEAVARRAVWYQLIFPTAVVLSAVYTEALFLCLAVGAMYAGRQQRWWAAALLGALAALTRSIGGLIVVPLVVQYAAAHAWRPSAWLRGALRFSVIPLAVAGYLLYVAALTGDLWAYSQTVAEGWRVHWEFPTAFFQDIATRPLFGYRDGMLDLIFGLLFTAMLPFIAFRLRPEYTVYAVLFTLLPLTIGSTMSLSRYLLSSWPHFLLLAQARWPQSPTREQLLSYAMLGALFLFTMRFTTWAWIG